MCEPNSWVTLIIDRQAGSPERLIITFRGIELVVSLQLLAC